MRGPGGICGRDDDVCYFSFQKQKNKKNKVLEASVDDVRLPAQLEAAGLVEAGIADLVVSNGVFNLCVDKRQAFLNARILNKFFTYSDLCSKCTWALIFFC